MANCPVVRRVTRSTSRNLAETANGIRRDAPEPRVWVNRSRCAARQPTVLTRRDVSAANLYADIEYTNAIGTDDCGKPTSASASGTVSGPEAKEQSQEMCQQSSHRRRPRLIAIRLKFTVMTRLRGWIALRHASGIPEAWLQSLASRVIPYATWPQWRLPVDGVARTNHRAAYLAVSETGPPARLCRGHRRVCGRP